MSSYVQWFSGGNLKSRRQAASLSRTVLASRVGVAVATVEAWEQGRAAPRADSLGAVCAVLECPVDDLFERANG